MRRLLILIPLLFLLQTACGGDQVSSADPPGVNDAGAATASPSDAADQPGHESATAGAETSFDGEQAFAYLEQQMQIPERWPGSEGHTAAGDLIISTLDELGWSVEEQRFDYREVEGRNIIGRANEGAGPVIILGAHYDTRRVADQTPGATEQGLSVPGAVDGASGVAVLLESARTLDLDRIPFEIWLAFFDLEDNGSGGLPGWDWIVGSSYMAENLVITPYAVVVVDMIGDADQQLYFDGNSDPELRETLWEIAGELGYSQWFIPEVKYTMIDDHLPFAQRGITAVDIIDFDYPYWHTVEDTADKASAESLHRVGRTLEFWLEQYLPEQVR
jgi:Zn-dependent M28 family amino/carboxypeptidase